MHRTETAIVGAGPYGLFIAAHRSGARLPFRIVGRVMEVWREHMPEGKLLKSDGFASDLSDPRANLSFTTIVKKISFRITRSACR
jgi:cation diffusion facilitator CzcD-associated flavoprotein CzcO